MCVSLCVCVCLFLFKWNELKIWCSVTSVIHNGNLLNLALIKRWRWRGQNHAMQCRKFTTTNHFNFLPMTRAALPLPLPYHCVQKLSLCFYYSSNIMWSFIWVWISLLLPFICFDFECWYYMNWAGVCCGDVSKIQATKNKCLLLCVVNFKFIKIFN